MLSRLMTMISGDYINGRFCEPFGDMLTSHDPARDGQPVIETRFSPARVGEAVSSAREAQRAWSQKSFDERLAALHRFRSVIGARKEELADAIVREIGKLRTEARVEIDSLIHRFDLVASQVRHDLRDGPLPGFPNEALRWHPHGVVGVIGPFNFPLHLCHAHVVPALLLGNAVVMKPSETAPLCGVRYAEAALEAGLPPGVLNVVQGKAETGALLVAHPDVRGLAFTGSWPVGRRISEAALDKPDMLVALEMGGKNTVVVCEDADLRQAAHEIVVGGYLTTGQRCTCTDRVLVHRSLARPLIDALRRLVSALRFGDPDDSTAFAGPMATAAGRAKLEHAIEAARARGAEVIVPGDRLPGGFYRTGSVHVLPEGVHDVAGYTDTELFGPDLGVELVGDDDEAIAVLAASRYGFATSVFTASDARFERYYRETRSGILNRNRSTNQASPRLPFGGTGRSGNFRPAGSFAPRNLAIPVAVQSNAVLSMTTHSALRANLPPHDLDRLEAMHEREEREEGNRSVLDAPRPMRAIFPKGGALPESTRWLERLYAGERVPREKKQNVFDHLRSHGPWMVSIDREPLAVLDAMSQTATSPFGFSHERLLRAYVEGEFRESMFCARDDGAGARFSDTLRTLVPGLGTVCFANSGAEANEKALALCRRENPSAGRRVLAFEGSFHGRTLLSLHATHSPSKRAPFEMQGYEARFAPWPLWASPGRDEPADTEGFLALCTAADGDGLEARFGSSDDPLLRAEVSSLRFVAEALRSGEYFAVIVEPMQSEGGDRYVTARFHRGLRLVTRALRTPLVMDEVQCGFGLGGSFAWHHRFGLRDAQGGVDTPDCVTFAKRAQVGVVLSRYDDPEPTDAYPASLVRGRLHALLVAESDRARVIEEWLRARIPLLERRYGHRIQNIRVSGFALAFDLSSPAELDAYLGQRFWRGAVAFGAGDRTVRYRLNASYEERDVERTFRAVYESLAWLDANPGKKAPAWEDPAASSRTPAREIRIVRLAQEDAESVLPRLVELESRVYEPARQDPPERLRLGFVEPDGVAIIAEVKGEGGAWTLAGYALGAPLECVSDVAGPDRDPARGLHDTFYSIALTVAPELQGDGIGRMLKRAQLEAARAMKRPDGTPRYRFASGRNRLGHADAMVRVNESFAAFTLNVLEGQYGEDGEARYYRQLLGPLRIESQSASEEARALDLSCGVMTPLAKTPPSLSRVEREGMLAGPAIDKITLLNYVTPQSVRAVEWAAALSPDLPHVFLSSGRDEALDKAVRMLIWHRKGARTVLSMRGNYVGHTTACARSVSDPEVHGMGAPHFDWPLVPHPEEGSEEESEAALRDAITRAGGASSVLGIVVESIQERTGRVLSPSFAERLGKLRSEMGIPLVVVDTASAYYRSGVGAFASDAWGIVPDARVWWTGGQLGMVHVGASLHVSTPMTFVSTWDGDELSLIQMHHQLRAARTLDIALGAHALTDALSELAARGIEVRGMGLYRVIAAGPRAKAIVDGLRDEGIHVKQLPGGKLVIAPALDSAVEDAQRLKEALTGLLPC